MAKKYKYDYPNQRELAKELRVGDKTTLAEWTGYSRSMITEMCRGKRKMTEKVEKLIKRILNDRKKQKEEFKIAE